jgi:16S rRNA (uracil1498-N3)-methyltransferase
MHHLFLPVDQFTPDSARILGSDHHHLAKVLRMRVGEVLVLLDNRGNAFRATLTEVGKQSSMAQIEERLDLCSEPPIPLLVAQAPGKSDKFEQVIQHGTEVGATAFLPLLTERGVVSLPPDRAETKRERWQQIAKGAAEQSHRLHIPQVHSPQAFRQWISHQTPETTLILHTDPALPTLAERLSQCLHPPVSLTLAVGAEGGWSPMEVSQAQAANISLVSLGKRILRTETAALVALSQILYHIERR